MLDVTKSFVGLPPICGPPKIDGMRSLRSALSLVFIREGAALPFILFSPVSRFLLADHPACVGAISLAAGCRKSTPGSRKTAPSLVVARRYYCDICTCNAWPPLCNYSKVYIKAPKSGHSPWSPRVHTLQFLQVCNVQIVRFFSAR